MNFATIFVVYTISAMLLKGKVIYFKGIHGYISSPGYNYKLYFHRSDVQPRYASAIKRGDEVGFEAITNKNRADQLQATNIYFIRFQPPTLLSLGIKEPDPKYLEVGQLFSWNGRAGHLKSPILKEKDTFLYYTRLIAPVVKPHDVIVYQPLESRDPRSTYFAYFALPIASVPKEMLSAICIENGAAGNHLLDDFLKLHFNADFLLCKIQIKAIAHQWEELAGFIAVYHNAYDEFPESFIKGLPEEIQVYFLEQGWIKDLPDDLFLRYFQNLSYAEKDRLLEQETDVQRKEWIIKNFIDWFIQTKQFYKTTRELKPVLFLLNKNITVGQGYLEQLIQVVFQMLSPEKIIDLWLRSLIIQLPSIDFLLQHFDLSDLDNIEALLDLPSDDQFANEACDVLFDYIFLNLNEQRFKENFPALVKFLDHYLEEAPEKFSTQILPELKLKLTTDQLFVLKCMGAHIDIDPLELLANCKLPVNIVFLIHFDSLSPGVLTEKILQDYLGTETLEHRLMADLLIFPWNALLDPADFLKNIFNKWKMRKRFFPMADADSDLAVHTFDGLNPKYSVHHLRLFIHYTDVLKDRLDFFGFMQPFKNLRRNEQKIIRDALNESIQSENTLFEREEIEPCTNMIEDGDQTTYFATILNIYFQFGTLALRLPDRSYTDDYTKVPWVTPGINHIPSISSLSKISIQIVVKNNSILKINGLTELYYGIPWGDILAILSKIKTEGKPIEGNVDYATDLKLKQTILQYLKENQISEVAPLPVYEYTGNYSRVRDHLTEKQFRKYLCHLYSIDVNNEISIIWESAEFDEISATFIFKTSTLRHKEQLNRIRDLIASYKNLRSYLIGTFNNENALIRTKKLEVQNRLRNYLGYIGNVRKRRGYIDAAERWVHNLEEVLHNTRCPEIEDEFEPHEVDWDFNGLILRKGNRLEIRNRRPKKGTFKQDPNTGDYFVTQEESDDLSPILNDLNNLNEYFLKGLNL